MGYNSVIVCNRHKQCVYSMRGEEGVDIQQLFRTHHRNCMKAGQVTIHCDADIDHSQYEDFWPYEERPAVVGIKSSSNLIRLEQLTDAHRPTDD